MAEIQNIGASIRARLSQVSKTRQWWPGQARTGILDYGRNSSYMTIKVTHYVKYG